MFVVRIERIPQCVERQPVPEIPAFDLDDVVDDLLRRLAPTLRVHEIGAIIAPPVPAFHLKPQSLTAAIDQIASRAINLLDLPGVRAPARSWQGETAKA